jgi:hypothetical protein
VVSAELLVDQLLATHGCLGVHIPQQMEPHIIAEKGDIQNFFFIHCKEVLKPSAILNVLKVVIFFQFMH